MDEKKVIIWATITFFLVFYSLHAYVQLAECREQLEQYRVELQASRDRLADASAVVTRTRESISIGADSVAELRKQITTIRKAFEDMENCLSNSSISSSDSDNSGGD